MKTLGIDLGSNSLGWAILDDVTAETLDKGVVVFPEGVDPDAKSSVDTPAAERRAARMGRRMKFRRKARKWNLLKRLIGAKMCPMTEEELAAWKSSGKYPIGNREFIDWLKATDSSNPYCDRDAASRGKVEPLVLGRALYHVCQRRGFRSSRKADAGDGDEKKQDKELGKVKGDIAKLTEEIADAGCATLGQYFYKRIEEEKGKLAKTRVRCRYTGRIEHYEKEFAVIMDAQGFAKDDDLRRKLHNAIFMQRPLRSQKHLVGKCPLEKHNARAQIGHPAFEEFRLRSFVNNLTLEDENGETRDELGNPLYPLTPRDRELICGVVAKFDKPTFKTVCKIFKKNKDERFADGKLHFHHYHVDDELPSCPTRRRIASAFGEIKYDEQKVFDALTFHDDDEKLREWFGKHYPALDGDAVESLVKFNPKEGNAQYSLKAIKLILPFLRRGFTLAHARFCAKLPKVVSDWAEREEEILRNLDELNFQYRRDKAAYAALTKEQRKNADAPIPLYDRYESYLLHECNVTKDKWNQLYLHGDDVYEPLKLKDEDGVEFKRLPPVRLGMIRNPLVQRAMTTLRRLVNFLGEHGKISPDDSIRIELARTVNDFATRTGWQLWQKERKRLRDEAQAEIAKCGKAATEDAIERCVLWKEQDGVCLYTGKQIAIDALLAGNAFDVEHTVPRSLSGDDSLANKTICDAAYNRQVKQGRLPKDCPNWDKPAYGYDPVETRIRPWREKLERLEKDYTSQTKRARGIADPAAKSAARAKAVATRFERDYWRDKLNRFDVTAEKLAAKDGELDSFKRRQLVDTGIMCSHAVALLKSVYPRTYAVNGRAVAFARKAWGIQADEAKDRSEHTHHAKDAMVIAALTPDRFTAICTALKDDAREDRRECKACPPPCLDFAEKVRRAAGEILVRHVLRQTTLKQSSKRNALAQKHPLKADPTKTVFKVLSKGDTVRGPLHKDTFYGCIKRPDDGATAFVVRKPLVGPLPAALALVDKIVDPAIRRIVGERLEEMKAQGVKFVNPGDVKMPSGVPVNKVRIEAHTTNPARLRDHATPSKNDYKNPYYVTSAEGSNFRLAVFRKDGKWSVAADNSLAWAQNHKKPDYVPFDRQEGFVGYVKPGSMALTHSPGHPEELRALTQKELVKRLYKVVKYDNSGRITLRLHTEARALKELSTALIAIGKKKDGESKISIEQPHELLYLSPKTYLDQMLFEGIHFKMLIDGTIKFNDGIATVR